MATNADMHLVAGASPMSTTNGTDWAADHFNPAAHIIAATTKLTSSASQKRYNTKMTKYRATTSSSPKMDHLMLTYDLIVMINGIDEPLATLIPHEGSANFTKFSDAGANAGGNQNQQRLVANDGLITAINDTIDTTLDANTTLSAPIRSGSTPGTKIIAALNTLGTTPKQLTKLCQKIILAPGTNAPGDAADFINVPGWKTYIKMASTVLGFFKHRRNAADEPLYAKEIDGWERLKDNIKFHTMFTPHIADLRAATSVADLIERVDGHYETMTSNQDDDDISLASITAGTVNAALGGGAGRGTDPDDCHGCGKKGCRITFEACPKHAEWLARKEAKSRSGEKRKTWEPSGHKQKVSKYDRSAKPTKPWGVGKDCRYKFNCKKLGNGCPFNHGGSLKAVKAGMANSKE
jgi:hypothetical protein